MKDMDLALALDRLDRDDISITWIACSEDVNTPADALRELADHRPQNSTFVVFDGSGHYEAPEVDFMAFFEVVLKTCSPLQNEMLH